MTSRPLPWVVTWYDTDGPYWGGPLATFWSEHEARQWVAEYMGQDAHMVRIEQADKPVPPVVREVPLSALEGR